MRRFRDAAGVEWTVYQTERNAGAERRDHLLPVEYRYGWLLFESSSEKRRLAPVPPGWSELSEEALAALCASAPVQSRRAKDGSPSPASKAGLGTADTKRDPSRMTENSIASELRTAEDRLTETLNEVCEAEEAKMLDTGELIRVKDTLAIASEAANKALSLRQKRGSTASEPGKPAPEKRD